MMRKLRRILRRFTWISFMTTFLGTVPAYTEVGSYLVGKRPITQPTGAAGLCERYNWACATSSTRAGGQYDGFDNKDLTRVRRINSAVNRRTRQIADQRQYARPEHWALPTRRGGDCEDFALLKKYRLIRAGIPAERLLIATVLDRRMRGHAVLVVRTGGPPGGPGGVHGWSVGSRGRGLWGCLDRLPSGVGRAPMGSVVSGRGRP